MEYGPVIEDCIRRGGINALGPGEDNSRDLASSLTTQRLFSHTTIRNSDSARACLAAILLKLGALEASHTISNSLSTAEGSYWHGLMHRREPDVHNSNYWYRKVGSHPIFLELRSRVDGLLQSGKFKTSGKWTLSEKWDPFSFNHYCDESRGSGSEDEAFCRQVQQIEWELLFEYCYGQAIKPSAPQFG